MSKPRVLCILPTPPPFAGSEVGSQMLLNSRLRDMCELIHLRSNIRASNQEKGKKDLKGLVRLIGLCWKQIWLIARRRPGITYTLLSQNWPGFFREWGGSLNFCTTLISEKRT